MMRISVIIRSYNRGYVLRDAIRSVLTQKTQPFEIIVVDDGSTDSTSEIVRSFGDSRIRRCYHATNRGVGAAGNTGILAARGELLSFLDSDDLWRPTFLEQQVAFLNANPYIDFSFTDVEVLGQGKRISSLVERKRYFAQLLSNKPQCPFYILTSREMYLCLLQELPIKMGAWVARRAMFEDNDLLDESWHSGEDWEFFLRIARKISFGYIDLPLLIQRHRADSTNRKFVKQDKLSLIRLLKRHKSILSNDYQGLESVRSGIGRQYRALAGVYLSERDARRAARTYLEGFGETRDAAMLFKAMHAILCRTTPKAPSSLAKPMSR